MSFYASMRMKLVLNILPMKNFRQVQVKFVGGLCGREVDGKLRQERRRPYSRPPLSQHISLQKLLLFNLSKSVPSKTRNFNSPTHRRMDRVI